MPKSKNKSVDTAGGCNAGHLVYMVTKADNLLTQFEDGRLQESQHLTTVGSQPSCGQAATAPNKAADGYVAADGPQGVDLPVSAPSNLPVARDTGVQPQPAAAAAADTTASAANSEHTSLPAEQHSGTTADHDSRLNQHTGAGLESTCNVLAVLCTAVRLAEQAGHLIREVFAAAEGQLESREKGVEGPQTEVGLHARLYELLNNLDGYEDAALSADACSALASSVHDA